MELLNLAGHFLFHDVRPWPHLWIPHCVLMSLQLRAALGGRKSAMEFCQKHPLGCYLLGLVYTFSGAIVSSVIIGNPPFVFLLRTDLVACASVVWYLAFFSPNDAFCALVDSSGLKVPMAFLQDVFRLKLVIVGVQEAHEKHPAAILYPIAMGFAKSSGFVFYKYFERIFFNNDGTRVERGFRIPNESTKTCLLFAVVFSFASFLASESGGTWPVSPQVLLFAFSWLSLAVRIAGLDPYVPLENIVCRVTFGTWFSADDCIQDGVGVGDGDDESKKETSDDESVRRSEKTKKDL